LNFKKIFFSCFFKKKKTNKMGQSREADSFFYNRDETGHEKAQQQCPLRLKLRLAPFSFSSSSASSASSSAAAPTPFSVPVKKRFTKPPIASSKQQKRATFKKKSNEGSSKTLYLPVCAYFRRNLDCPVIVHRCERIDHQKWSSFYVSDDCDIEWRGRHFASFSAAGTAILQHQHRQPDRGAAASLARSGVRDFFAWDGAQFSRLSEHRLVSKKQEEQQEKQDQERMEEEEEKSAVVPSRSSSPPSPVVARPSFSHSRPLILKKRGTLKAKKKNEF
jgi:hypothetical protein